MSEWRITLQRPPLGGPPSIKSFYVSAATEVEAAQKAAFILKTFEVHRDGYWLDNIKEIRQ